MMLATVRAADRFAHDVAFWWIAGLLAIFLTGELVVCLWRSRRAHRKVRRAFGDEIDLRGGRWR